MPLIKCPDCGNEVSSFATTCPRCGYPISSIRNKNIIKIKTPPPNGNAIGQFRIINMDTNQELQRIAQGGLVQIESQTPLNLGISWGLGLKPAKGFCFTVNPGKKYALSWTEGWFIPGIVCNEVDVFDSD